MGGGMGWWEGGERKEATTKLNPHMALGWYQIRATLVLGERSRPCDIPASLSTRLLTISKITNVKSSKKFNSYYFHKPNNKTKCGIESIGLDS